MPATVYVRFDVDAPVSATPRRLHAAWGRVLDLPEGLDPARAAAFPALAHRPPHGLAALAVWENALLERLFDKWIGL